jgi:4-amino-4-deoxy-L-arabinose transferase-like glycosyltransferase
MIKNSKLALIISFCAIIALATFLRFWHLDTIPNGIHPDAAVNAIDAFNANQSGNYKVFYEANNGREGLFINIIALFMRVFGYNLFAYKLAGVFTGIFSVIGMYFLGKEFGGRKLTGLFASFLMAVSFWMILFDRTGLRATFSVLMIIWASYFFLRGIRRNAWYDYAISGIFLGAGFHTYIPFRFVPIIFVAVMIYHILLEVRLDRESLLKSLKDNSKFLWAIPISLIVASPILLYFYHNSQFLIGRSSEVSVFSQPHSILLLFISSFANLGMFFFYGDPNWRHNFSTEPALSAIEGMFFIIGCIMVIRYIFKRQENMIAEEVIIRKTNYVYMVILFVFMFIPAGISYSPGGIPHALRMIDTAPAVFAVIALAMTFAYDRIKKYFSAKTALLLVLLFTFYASANVFVKYFYRWGGNNQVKHELSEDFTNLSKYINSQANLGNKIAVIESNSEIEFFTLETSNLIKMNNFDQSAIDNFRPNMIIFSEKQGDQGDYYLTSGSWEEISGPDFGIGGHNIIIYKKL